MTSFLYAVVECQNGRIHLLDIRGYIKVVTLAVIGQPYSSFQQLVDRLVEYWEWSWCTRYCRPEMGKGHDAIVELYCQSTMDLRVLGTLLVCNLPEELGVHFHAVSPFAELRIMILLELFACGN